MAQPGRPQRKPQPRRRLQTPAVPATPVGAAAAATAHPAAPVSDALAAGAALRERRRSRAHVRDYMYVRAEVRSILILAFVIVVAITGVSFLFH